MRRWIPAIVIIALLAAGFLLIRPAPQLGSFTMSDGTVVEVAKITTGTVHRFRYDNRWQDYAGWILPRTLRSNLQSRIAEHITTNANSLVVWMRRVEGRNAMEKFRLDLADDHGVELVAQFRAVFTATIGNVAPSDGANVFGWRLDAFPRHGKEMVLHVHNVTGASKPIREIRVANPAPQKRDALRPVPLPTTKSAGDLDVVLVSVETRPAAELTRVNTTIILEVIRNGLPAADWRLVNYAIFTEDSPVLPSMAGLTAEHEGGRTRLHLLSGLWPDQPWKLRFWFAPTENFTTNQVWTLNDISRQPFQATFQSPQSSSLTVNLRLETSRQLYLQFVGDLDKDCVKLIRASDDQGRSLRSLVSAGTPILFPSSSAGMQFPSFFLLWPDTKTSTIEFAVLEARSVEFIVKPTLRP